MSTTNNTFGVAFYLKKQKTTQAGKSPIYARITVNGKRIEISVKRSIEENNWNVTKGMAKGSREETVKLNKYLDQFKAGIIDSYQQLLLQKKFITAELLKEKVTGGDQADFTLCKLMEYHNSDQGLLLELGTMKNYYTTQKYIKEFIKERFKTSDKYLSELSYKFITDFEYYLRNRTPEKGQKALNNNGLMKHLERFCKMINLAVRLEWIDRNPFHAYQLKFDKVEREYLTKDELARIEAKKFNIIRLQVVQDLFLFSCYTGLAYIDTMNLTTENIVKGIDGNDWLITSRQKTDTDVRIPLLPQAEILIKKYQNHPKAANHGTLFPVISNQKTNAYLKEIADVCNINKAITFHIARHTFATTITLSNGVPIESVSKMLGHTSIRSTQVYAKVIEQKLSEDMQNLKKRMANQ